MNKIQLFEDRTIRTAWNEEEEEWYFSVVDVVSILTESKDATTGRKYWNKLKQRLKAEGNELVTKCHQLKMTAADGKKYKTDVANTRDLLRIIQSVPSPKAEPFKKARDSMRDKNNGWKLGFIQTIRFDQYCLCMSPIVPKSTTMTAQPSG